jgi:chromosome partitioning protein
MAQITAIASQKGGTAKTAVTASLGPLLALARARQEDGGRVLLVDLDQQADLTALFGYGAHNLDATVVDALAPVSALPLDQAIVRDVHGVAGLDLLPSDDRAAGLEKQLAGEMMREQKLAALLEGVADQYAHVLIDCPPSLGDLTLNGLCAADEALVPVNMEDDAAVRGALNVTRTIATLRQQRQRVTLRALLRVRVDHRVQTYAPLNEALTDTELPVARTELQARADWRSSVVERTPVVLWKPSGDAARDVRELAAELWPDDRVPHASELRKLVRDRARHLSLVEEAA